MGWICEECGYENEFRELTQITKCDCCGEPASDQIKRNAMALINAKRREEERRLKAIEEERIAKHKQNRFEKMKKAVISVSKFIKEAVTVAVLFSVCMIAVWGTVTISSSNDVIEQFYNNIKISSSSHFETIIENNTAEIGSQLKDKYHISTKNICIIGDDTIVYSNNVCENASLIVGSDSNNTSKTQFGSNVTSIYKSILRRLRTFIHM